MPKQLKISSDEVYETAHRLARQMNRSVEEVVTEAVRDYERKAAPVDEDLFTPEAIEARKKKLFEIIESIKAEGPPITSVDHSDLYDEYGLPK